MQSLRLLIIAQIVLLGSSTKYFRYVKPNNSSSSCPDQPCLTLDQYAQRAEKYFTTGSTFQFLAGNHSLQNSVKLTNISEIILGGKETDSVTIICKNELSIICENVTNLSIQGLTFLLYSINTNKHLSALSIYNSKEILLLNLTFVGNVFFSKTLVRAIYSMHSTIIIANCLFKGNTGYDGGAIYASDGSTVTLSASNFIENEAMNDGGAIFANTSSIILKETHTCNSAWKKGAQQNSNISIHGSKQAVFQSCTLYFFNNTAQGFGGAIYLQHSMASMSGTAIRFVSNSAIQGGAIYAGESEVTSNTRNLSFTSNKAKQFGGAYAGKDGLLTLGESDSSYHSFTQNSAGIYGGAILHTLGKLNIAGRSHFANNFIPDCDYCGGGAVLLIT